MQAHIRLTLITAALIVGATVQPLAAAPPGPEVNWLRA